MPQKKIFIEGMHCRSCEILLEEDLGKLSGVKRVNANFQKGTAFLSGDGALPDDGVIGGVIEKAGYTLSPTAPIYEVSWINLDVKRFGVLLFALALIIFLGLIIGELGWSEWSLSQASLSTNLSLILLIGLVAGVSTCAALVGGLVLGVATRYSTLHPELTVREKLVPHLWFHLGRVGGFAFLGGLLGLLGEKLSVSIGFTAFITLFAGGVMFFLGLQLTEIFPRLSRWSFTLPKGVARIFGVKQTDEKYTHRGAMILGAATFFAPCGFTQAVQLAVIASGSAFFGALAMPLFALGTIPGLALLGGLGSAAKGFAREFLTAFIAMLLVGFGWWNMTSGLHLFGIDTTITERSKTTEQEAGTAYAPLENGVQVIRITQDSRGYHPSELPELKVGVPARLIIYSTDSYTCAASFVIPEFDIKKQLQPGENVIDFVPKKSGKLPFSCSMGMFRGSLEVR